MSNAHVPSDNDALMSEYDDVLSIDELKPVEGPRGQKEYEIWFNGLNIDSRRAHHHMAAGDLERLAEGIYINVRNKAWMPEMTPKRRRDLILAHATRIGAHIYSDATLAGSSAYHRGPVEGVLCLAAFGKSKYPHKNIGNVLTIYHTNIEQGLPPGAQALQCEHEDTFGETILNVLPDELLILQAFTPYRRKPPGETRLSLSDLAAIIKRAEVAHGSEKKLVERLEEISQAMGYAVQLRLAKEAIRQNSGYTQRKRNLFEYFVYWNKVRTGVLAYDGAAWRFDYDPAFKLKLSLNKKLREGVVPSFLGSVLPEKGELDELIERGFSEFKMADRYISNITVRKTTDNTIFSMPTDRLEGKIENFWGQGYTFAGTIGEDLSSILQLQSMDPTILTNAMEDPRCPRISGVQLKLAGYLSEEGVLMLANDRKRPFTHIIKPPPPGHKCTVGTMEWFGMSLAQLCGLVTENFAIAELGGYGPTFIAERFDIRQDRDDEAMYLLEDFWSIKGLRNQQHKYSGDLLEVARSLMELSTDAEDDGRRLFKQTVFSWLTVNSDMHLKNLMMMKVGNEDLSSFEHVRLTPCYDLLCTNVYPNDPKSAALSLGGTKYYTLGVFRDLAKTLKIKSDEAETIIKDLIVRLVEGADAIYNNLPTLVRAHEPSMVHLATARAMLQQRCRATLSQFDDRKTHRISFGGEPTPEETDTLSFTGDDASQPAVKRQGLRP